MKEHCEDVVCPECGRDVCTLHDTKRAWTHRSRVIPMVIWVFLLVGFLGIFSPMIQGGLGAYRASWSSVSQPVSSLVNVRDSTISSEIVRQASKGNAEARERLVSLFEQIEESRAKGFWPRKALQFAFVTPDGMHSTGQTWGVGGAWYRYWVGTSLNDARVPESFDPFVYDPDVDYGDTYIGYGGSTELMPYVRTEIHLKGAQIRTMTIDQMNILAALALCVVVVFAVRKADRKQRIPWLHRKHARVVLFLGLVAMMVGLAFQFSREWSGVSFSKPASGATAWIPDEDMQQLLVDDQAADRVIDMIVEAIPDDENVDYVLGDLSDSGYFSKYSGGQFGLNDSLHLIRWSMLEYAKVNPGGTESPMELPAFYERGFRVRAIDVMQVYFEWRGEHAIRGVRVSFTSWALLLVVFYWLWRFGRWIGTRAVYSVENKRLLRGECTFCGYPLSKDALVLRSEALGS